MGKLMKHELRSYWKTFLPLWGAMLVLSVINGFTLRGVGSFFSQGIPMLVFGSVVLASGVLTLVLVLQRFYQGLLGNEGYLVLTLPLSRRQILGAKLLSAVLVEMLSLLAAAASCALLVILATRAKPEGLKLFFEMLNVTFEDMPKESALAVLMVFELVLMAILAAAEKTLHMYAAMSIGHLAKKQRIALSMVAYVAINVVGTQLLALLIRAAGKLDLHFPWDYTDFVSSLGSMCASLAGILLLELAACGLLWVVSEYILKKKLNLE